MTRGPSHYQRDEARRAPVVCHKCGELAREVHTKYGLRSDCCGMWSWNRHPLVDAATHEARKAAHAAFDKLWRHGPLRRRDAYARVSRHFGRQIHMKELSAADARKVEEWAKAEMQRKDEET